MILSNWLRYQTITALTMIYTIPGAAPTARKASSQERALWGSGRVPTPTPPSSKTSG